MGKGACVFSLMCLCVQLRVSSSGGPATENFSNQFIGLKCQKEMHRGGCFHGPGDVCMPSELVPHLHSRSKNKKNK